MKNFLKWVFDRAEEPSTWRGLTVVLTTLGVILSPAQTAAIITAGAAIAGAIEVFRKEKKQ